MSNMTSVKKTLKLSIFMLLIFQIFEKVFLPTACYIGVINFYH